MIRILQLFRSQLQGRQRRPHRHIRTAASCQSLETRQLLAATLIRDFDTGTFPGGPYLTGDTYGLGNASVVFQDSLYFTDYTTLNRSDSSGTQQIIDVGPGEEYVQIKWLQPVADRLYFSAPNATHQGLWVSDGTSAGTRALRELEADCIDPEFLTPFNDSLLFVADSASTGYELWRSDGTSAGTQLVLDLVPGTGYGNIQQLTVVGNTVYFVATLPDSGREIWRTDGTASGTQLLLDVAPGNGSSFPGSLTAVGDRLYFTASTPGNAPTLWTSDGTTAGTVQVLDALNNPISVPAGLFAFGSSLLFSASSANGREVWRADGTAASEVLDLRPGSAGSFPAGFTRLGNQVCFAADDGVHGNELWATDGTAAGTQLVADLNTSGSASPIKLASTGQYLFFAATHEDFGTEVWRSDGTAAGTMMLQDIFPGLDSGFDPTIGIKTGSSTAYFSAGNAETGIQIWGSDGTAAGTQMLSTPKILPLSGDVAEFSDLNGSLLFIVRNAPGQLWKTFGTDASTSLVRDLLSESPANLTPLQNNVIFLGPASAGGYALWKTDGTDAGTTLVRDINPTGSIGYTQFVEFQGSLYFAAEDPDNGAGLWKTDGTEAGTERLASVFPTFLWPNTMFQPASELYFAGGAAGDELWKTDGTTSGTVQIKAVGTIGVGAMLNGQLYFVANDGIHGDELWTSDGTAAGTILVQDLHPGPQGSSISSLQVVNNRLIFFADDGTHGFEPWTSDGTAAGTSLLFDIRSGAGDGVFRISPSAISSIERDRLYFPANDGIHGREPWSSDGTAAGTRLLRDLQPGPRSSNPEMRAAAQSLVYMYANDGIVGKELWQSDGTTDGTQLTVDLAPGIAPSVISEVQPSGNVLYLTGFSPVGYELFSVPINRRPSDINLSSQTIFENQPTGTAVGELLVTDPDSANQATFTLVSGAGDTDNLLFTINGNLLQTAAELNFEAGSVRSIRVRATDAEGQTFERQLTIYIQDVNETPTFDQPADIFATEDDAPLTISLTGISAGDNEQQPLKITATSSNTSLIATPQISYVSPATTGSLSITLAPARSGTSTVTVTIEDGGPDGDLTTTHDNLSLTRAFLVSVAATRPVFTAPLGTTFQQRPLFTFTPIPFASGYQIWIGNRSTGQLPVLQAHTVQPEFQVPVDLGIGRFDAYVRTRLPGNQYGPWSLLNRFTINTRAEVSPIAARQTTSRPTITLTPLSGAVTYDFWLDNRSTGQTQFVRTQVSLPQWTPNQDLPMARYRIWAKAIAVDGTAGGWSLQQDFLVATAPKPLSPLSSTFNRQPTFSWSGVAGATSYEIAVRSGINGQVIATASGLTGTSWTPATPLPDGPLNWQVIADSTTAGFRSDWSERISFYVGGRPALTAPAGIIGTAQPTLQWKPVGAAASYEVWLNRVYSEGQTTKVFSTAGITGNQYPLTLPLTNGASYRYWVRAVSAQGETSPWSVPLDFSVQLTQTEAAGLDRAALPENRLALHLQLLNPDVSGQSQSPSHRNSQHVAERPVDVLLLPATAQTEPLSAAEAGTNMNRALDETILAVIDGLHAAIAPPVS